MIRKVYQVIERALVADANGKHDTFPITVDCLCCVTTGTHYEFYDAGLIYAVELSRVSKLNLIRTYEVDKKI